MDIKISALPSATEVTGNDESPGVQSGSTKKFTMSQISEYILNTFSSLSLGGVARTVKAAIDAIATTVTSHTTLLGNSTMGTTATTVTGAIAEHETDITTLNSNLVATPVNVSIYGNNISDLTSVSYRVGNIAILSGYFHATSTLSGQTTIMTQGIADHYRADGYVIQRNAALASTAAAVIPIYSDNGSNSIILNKQITGGSDWCFFHMVLVLK